MVLGLRTKSKRLSSINVDYNIYIQEIKPWPPSKSFNSISFVSIHWENGSKNSGSLGPFTTSVVPGKEGKIELNKSFQLQASFSILSSRGESNKFQKNCLELNLYEAHKNKIVKGQLLGSFTLNLAEYGIWEDDILVTILMNSKRIPKNAVQPVLFIKISVADKDTGNLLARRSLSEISLNEENSKCGTGLMMKEYDEETKTSSLIIDDVSSQGSLNISSPAFQSFAVDVVKLETENDSDLSEEIIIINGSSDSPLKMTSTNSEQNFNSLPNGYSSRSSSVDLTSYPGSPEDCDSLISTNTPGKNLLISTVSPNNKIDPLPSRKDESMQENVKNETKMFIYEKGNIPQQDLEKLLNSSNIENRFNNTTSSDRLLDKNLELRIFNNGSKTDDAFSMIEDKDVTKCGSSGILDDIKIDESCLHAELQACNSKNILFNQECTIEDSLERSKLSRRAIGSRSNPCFNTNGNAKDSSRDPQNIFHEQTVEQLNSRVEVLETELKVTTVLEVGLYSVAAEHGSSAQKIHASARYLSRLYIHSFRKQSKESRAIVAKNTISGLIVVVKSCGGDVSRLTFWLSNLIILRGIIMQSLEDMQNSESILSEINNIDALKENGLKSSLTWKESTIKKETRLLASHYNDWDDAQTFISALEKIETWIFSQIVELVWWQNLVPPLQSISENHLHDSSENGRSSSMTLWKRVCSYAFERICPVRAEGNACGCLSLLPRLIMEQCMRRLDVSMFNAILQESTDGNATDHVSDTIVNSNVLPIVPGEISFGAGAHLRNSIGNLSSWLSNKLDMKLNDSTVYKNGNKLKREGALTTSKLFPLLNALSNLLMLPKDMLLCSSIRREVCPVLGASLIKRILYNFVPDEFCPDIIPDGVFQALDFEELLGVNDGSYKTYPCKVRPITYFPPSMEIIEGCMKDMGIQSQNTKRKLSIIQSFRTINDELAELDSLMHSIGLDALTSSALKSNIGNNGDFVRYHLLREV